MTTEQELIYTEYDRLNQYYARFKLFKGNTEASVRPIMQKMEDNYTLNVPALEGLSNEELEQYLVIFILHYNTHYRDVSVGHDILSCIKEYNFNAYFIKAIQYFVCTKLNSFNYNVHDIIGFKGDYECITDLYSYIDEKDKAKYISSMTKLLSKNYNSEILAYRLDPTYKIQFNRMSFFNRNVLTEYNEYVKPVSLVLLKRILSIVGSAESLNNYNTILIDTYKLAFMLAGDTFTENDYEVLAITMDVRALREQDLFFRKVINSSMVDNFTKLAEAYIEYVSTRNNGILLNRLGKLENSKMNNKNNEVKSAKSKFFGNILFKALFDYEGSSKYLIKKSIDSQI